jgi:RimJ/RimL family protein N-acetyltransferase
LPHYRKLVGTKVYLSPPSPEDAEIWANWDNDLEVTLPLGDEAYLTLSLEAEQNHLAEDLRLQRPVFSIIDLANDAVIGRCMLFAVEPLNRRAMLGIVIGEKSYWGRGYGQDALRLLLDYGFNLLNLNSISLGVFTFNERAIQAYRKVGFREVGVQRQARIIAGRKIDVLLMDILAEDFTAGNVPHLLDQMGG